MRIAIGQFRELDHDLLTFAAQLGASGVVPNTPVLPGAYRWEVEDLRRLRDCVEEYGLRVESLENTPVTFYDKAMLGLPGRDEQIELSWPISISVQARAMLSTSRRNPNGNRLSSCGIQTAAPCVSRRIVSVPVWLTGCTVPSKDHSCPSPPPGTRKASRSRTTRAVPPSPGAVMMTASPSADS